MFVFSSVIRLNVLLSLGDKFVLHPHLVPQLAIQLQEEGRDWLRHRSKKFHPQLYCDFPIDFDSTITFQDTEVMNSEAGPGMLPEEILALIIQMAMDGPALERYREENVEFGWPFIVDNSDLRETFPQASKPKLPIALVSRTFWRIALKFLYDTIILTNVVSLKLLVNVLSLRSSHSNYRIADYIKSVIILPPAFIGDVADVGDFSLAIISVMGHCTALQRVVMRTPNVAMRQEGWEAWGAYGPRIVRAIPSSVTYLDIYCYRGNWQLYEMESKPQLRYLRITGRVDEGDNMLSYKFPALSHFSVDIPRGNCARFCASWQMESLTHLYLHEVGNDLEDIRPFWEKQKPSILLLHLGGPCRIDRVLARAILGGVPNLRTLEYSHPGEVPPIWENSALPRTLERVTVATRSAYLRALSDYLCLAEQLHEFQHPPMPAMKAPPTVLITHDSAMGKTKDELECALLTFPGKANVQIRGTCVWAL